MLYLGYEQRPAREPLSLFQRLWLASRVCYVTDHGTLASVHAWQLAWQAAQKEEG